MANAALSEVLPPPFARQSMKPEDLTDVTPESRQECSEMTKDANLNSTIYDSWSEKWKVMFPGLNGGTNWGSASFDEASVFCL